MHISQAVILAGGLGTRLGEITRHTPKPMVSLNGKPFLEWLILELRQQGIDRFVFCIGYLAEQIQSYFQNGNQFGCTIQYAVEEKPLGTGGAIKNAGTLLDEAFLILNGDNYLMLSYPDFIEKFHQTKSKIGMLACWCNTGDTFASNVDLNENTLTIKKYDYLNSKGLRYVDSGVKIFSKKLLSHFPAQGTFSLEVDVLPKLTQESLLCGYRVSDYARDIGTLKTLHETQTFFAAHKTSS